jgi:hypothetical protein
MNDVLRAMRAWVVGMMLTVFARDLCAKAEPVALPELVRQSSTIVLGQIPADDLTKAAEQWVSFKSSQVFKGDAALAGRTIQLCNSPPPMREYPKISLLTGEVILFLVAKESGCFEFSHTTRSVVEVHDGEVMTAAIADQPLEQSFEAFIGKLRKLVAKKTGTSH